LKSEIFSFLSFFSDTVWDVFPNSPLAFLVYLGGVFIFCLLLIFYFARKKDKENNKKESPKEVTLDDLLKIANNPKSTTADLLSALMLYNDRFNVAENKEKSMLFFEKVLNHKHRHKKLFDYFHGSILPKNIKFKDELDELEKKALNK
jgi:hypothetical protein